MKLTIKPKSKTSGRTQRKICNLDLGEDFIDMTQKKENP